jgi:metallo-beta-lactamase class B
MNIVYADSLTPVAAPGFRFTGGDGKPSLVETFRRSIATVEQLPCDILLTPHPSASGMDRRREQAKSGGGSSAFVDRNACRALAAGARKQLDERVAKEAKENAPPLLWEFAVRYN